MQLYDNDFFTITHDPASAIITIAWTEKTAHMRDDDFKEALERFAGFAEGYKARRLRVDVTRFRHALSPEIGAWRDEIIVPKYHDAGVERFAYVVGEGAPAPADEGDAPEEAARENFSTRFFTSEEAARVWLSDA